MNSLALRPHPTLPVTDPVRSTASYIRGNWKKGIQGFTTYEEPDVRIKRKYSDGGKVVKDHLADYPLKTPTPETLGAGMAAKAAKDLTTRKSKLDKAIADAGG